MAKFDLVIRGGIVVTAADTVVCDVGIEAGKVVALAQHLAPGAAPPPEQSHQCPKNDIIRPLACGIVIDNPGAAQKDGRRLSVRCDSAKLGKDAVGTANQNREI